MEGGLTKVGKWDFKGIMLSQSDRCCRHTSDPTARHIVEREMKDLEKQPSLWACGVRKHIFKSIGAQRVPPAKCWFLGLAVSEEASCRLKLEDAPLHPTMHLGAG